MKQTGSVRLQMVQQLAAEMFPQPALPQSMSLADAHQAAEVGCNLQASMLNKCPSAQHKDACRSNAQAGAGLLADVLVDVTVVHVERGIVCALAKDTWVAGKGCQLS